VVCSSVKHLFVTELATDMGINQSIANILAAMRVGTATVGRYLERSVMSVARVMYRNHKCNFVFVSVIIVLVLINYPK